MNAFNNVLDKSRTRNFGGTSASYACEPYISGYCFIKWFLPPRLTDFLGSYVPSTDNDQVDFKPTAEYCGKVLSAAFVGITPPGQSIDFVEYRGSCGVVWNNPMRVNYGHNLSIKYIEMSGLPIYRIHKCWLDMIRDAHQGVKGKNYESDPINQRDNYAGGVLYWTTKPDGVTVEYCCAYSGVVPERDNQEAFASDISSVDKVELDMSYRIDHLWTDSWVFEEVKKAKNEFKDNLWSRDGFMYKERQASVLSQTPSKL